MELVKAKIEILSGTSAVRAVDVMFNPTEYSVDRGANYAEIAVPGLSMPLLQFVRGEARQLSLELFLDGTDERRSVNAELTALRSLVEIAADLHSPPVCRFTWGDQSFDGVVTSLREKFTLFDPSGKVQRARVNITFKSYAAADVQLANPRRESPDRTRVRVVREGDTLERLAYEAYGDPALWRAIAEENDIARPRFLTPGAALRIPAL